MGLVIKQCKQQNENNSQIQSIQLASYMSNSKIGPYTFIKKQMIAS